MLSRLRYTLFCVLRILWQLCLKIIKKFGLLVFGKQIVSYASSCTLNKIILRHYNVQFSHLCDTSSNFIWHCTAHVHPEYVLRSDVIFCTVQEDCALFLQLPKSLTEYGALKFWNLTETFYLEATHMLSMPIDNLIRLAAEVGEPKIPVVFLASTGHCGSSLFARIIQNCGTESSTYGHVLSLSEPDWLMNMFNNFFLKKLDPKREHLTIIRSALYLALKPIKGVDSYFVKLPSFLTGLLPTVLDLLPQAKAFYLMRKDRMATIRSMEREFGGHIGLRCGWYCSCICRILAKAFPSQVLQQVLINTTSSLRMYGRADVTALYYNVLGYSLTEYLAMFQAERLMEYQRYLACFPQTIIYYECLLQEPVKCIKPVIEALNLNCSDEFLLQKAHEAMGYDSKMLGRRSQPEVRKYKNMKSDMYQRITVFYNALKL